MAPCVSLVMFRHLYSVITLLALHYISDYFYLILSDYVILSLIHYRCLPPFTACHLKLPLRYFSPSRSCPSLLSMSRPTSASSPKQTPSIPSLPPPPDRSRDESQLGRIPRSSPSLPGTPTRLIPSAAGPCSSFCVPFPSRPSLGSRPFDPCLRETRCACPEGQHLRVSSSAEGDRLACTFSSRGCELGQRPLRVS